MKTIECFYLPISTKIMRIIETSRTFLRKFTADDFDDIAAILSNPRVMKYLGVSAKPVTRDETKQILDSINRLWKNKGYGRMAVVSKDDNKLIGMAGLRHFEGDAELFYLLDEPYWGQGLATEIGKAILEYGFETFDFPRIIAVTRPSNAATLRVLDKLGLKYEKEDLIAGVRAHIFTLKQGDFHSKNMITFPYIVKARAASQSIYAC